MKNMILVISGMFAVLSVQAKQEEVSISRDWGDLHGTLVVPDAGSDVAAVIIAGSGPTNRNGNSILGLMSDSYSMLAQALERSGIASLRYDKRGVGASRYVNPEFKPENVRFEDFIEDAEACAEYLGEAGFEKIVLIGHSEGSLIALIAAAETPTVDAVVSLSGPGYPIGYILLTQLKDRLADYKPEMLPHVESIISRMEQGETVPEDEVPQELQALFRPSVQPFLISQMRYDPREVIRRVEQPVIVIGGDNDLQISVESTRALADAQPRAELHIIEGLTHVLKISSETELQKQLTAVYTNGKLPISEELVDATASFIRNLK